MQELYSMYISAEFLLFYTVKLELYYTYVRCKHAPNHCEDFAELPIKAQTHINAYIWRSFPAGVVAQLR